VYDGTPARCVAPEEMVVRCVYEKMPGPLAVPNPRAARVVPCCAGPPAGFHTADLALECSSARLSAGISHSARRPVMFTVRQSPGRWDAFACLGGHFPRMGEVKDRSMAEDLGGIES
jgi:hypothetical protein